MNAALRYVQIVISNFLVIERRFFFCFLAESRYTGRVVRYVGQVV